MVDVSDTGADSPVATAAGFCAARARPSIRFAPARAQGRGDPDPRACRHDGGQAHRRSDPLCHPLVPTKVEVAIAPDDALPGFASRRRFAPTGHRRRKEPDRGSRSPARLVRHAEAVDRTMEIGGIAVTSKTGGKSGDWLIDFDQALRWSPGATPSAPSACRWRRRRAGHSPSRSRRRSAPRLNARAMDGYAVREADLPGRLNLVGQSFPALAMRARWRGQCVRIFTGGPCPDGADRVVIQEMVLRETISQLIGEVPRTGPTHNAGEAAISRWATCSSTRGRCSARGHWSPRGRRCRDAASWRRPQVVVFVTGESWPNG